MEDYFRNFFIKTWLSGINFFIQWDWCKHDYLHYFWRKQIEWASDEKKNPNCMLLMRDKEENWKVDGHFSIDKQQIPFFHIFQF